jgi:hypothetical protein
MKKPPSRAQVFHGNGLETAGGLRKADLFKDTDGSIKSKAASKAAKKRMTEEGSKAMVKVFRAKKGTFKPQPKQGTPAYKKLIKKM